LEEISLSGAYPIPELTGSKIFPNKPKKINKMSIQKVDFTNGEFALHKIPFNEKSHMSAWFDKNGKILDAEFMPSGRKVQEGGPAWDKAESCGKIYGVEIK
jgi:hypothetical protein